MVEYLIFKYFIKTIFFKNVTKYLFDSHSWTPPNIFQSNFPKNKKLEIFYPTCTEIFSAHSLCWNFPSITWVRTTFIAHLDPLDPSKKNAPYFFELLIKTLHFPHFYFFHTHTFFTSSFDTGTHDQLFYGVIIYSSIKVWYVLFDGIVRLTTLSSG